ncbi:porin family protein [Vibrio penaeicida]|uniref:porin family protein n=1 Tax=Vibrio penaeicida TaxID=104609 RepID=UPI002735A0D2|nr:porin family protein [Vibrio penaeicida]MDP2575468.1 porin family protein [Vibrio penaeicida]
MNKTILLSALSLAIALPAQAQEDKAPTSVKTEGFYAGLDLGLSGESSASGKSISSDNPYNSDLDIASGFHLGYEFKANDKINVAAELEFYNWGNYKTFSDSAAEAYITSTALNVKPKYYVNDNIYIGGTLGYGSYTLNLDLVNSFAIKTSSENGFIYGLEGGYQHHNGVLARAGYKKTSIEDGGITLDLSSFYVGIGYKF